MSLEDLTHPDTPPVLAALDEEQLGNLKKVFAQQLVKDMKADTLRKCVYATILEDLQDAGSEEMHDHLRASYDSDILLTMLVQTGVNPPKLKKK